MEQKDIDEFKEAVNKLTESLNTLNGATQESDKNFSDVFGKKFPNAGMASIKGLQGLGDAATSAAAVNPIMLSYHLSEHSFGFFIS